MKDTEKNNDFLMIVIMKNDNLENILKSNKYNSILQAIK